jgi:hypothetical protein
MHCKGNLSVSAFKTDGAYHRHIDGVAVQRVAGSTDEIILRERAGLAICVVTREARIYGQVCAALCLTCQEGADNARRTENARLTWPLSVAV